MGSLLPNLRLRTSFKDRIYFLPTPYFVFSRHDGLEWCGLLVDYCDVFISSLDYTFVGKCSFLGELFS